MLNIYVPFSRMRFLQILRFCAKIVLPPICTGVEKRVTFWFLVFTLIYRKLTRSAIEELRFSDFWLILKILSKKSSKSSKEKLKIFCFSRKNCKIVSKSQNFTRDTGMRLKSHDFYDLLKTFCQFRIIFCFLYWTPNQKSMRQPVNFLIFV